MRLHPLYCQLSTTEATFHVRAAKNTGLPLPKAPHQVWWYPSQRGRQGRAILILLLSRLSFRKKQRTYLYHTQPLLLRQKFYPMCSRYEYCTPIPLTLGGCSGEILCWKRQAKETRSYHPTQCPANKSGVSLKEKES